MPEQPRRRRLRDWKDDLSDVVWRALDQTHIAGDIPGKAIEQGAKAITRTLGELDHIPNVGEVTKIVEGALGTAVQGAGVAAEAAGTAAEAAGEVAGNIVEGLGKIDLSGG